MAKPLTGQFIAFLFHANAVYQGIPATAPAEDTIETRDFLLGDEWLYLKIYCTPQVADQILGGVLPLFVSQHEQELCCWFFIRYNEGGDHLRIRFKTHPPMIGRLLVNFLAILRLTGTDQLIRSYQGDTYQRELERYRPEFIGLAENVFREGSGLVCSRLANASPESGSTGEFLFALATADRLLYTFLQPGEITGFCALVLENFHIEFDGGKPLRSGMDTAYRKLKYEIEITLTKQHGVADRLPSAELLAEAAGKLPDMERNRLLADIIHMQMNRSFQTRQRHQEYFVYHCLLKYRSSAAAKANHSA